MRIDYKQSRKLISENILMYKLSMILITNVTLRQVVDKTHANNFHYLCSLFIMCNLFVCLVRRKMQFNMTEYCYMYCITTEMIPLQRWIQAFRIYFNNKMIYKLIVTITCHPIKYQKQKKSIRNNTKRFRNILRQQITHT